MSLCITGRRTGLLLRSSIMALELDDGSRIWLLVQTRSMATGDWTGSDIASAANMLVPRFWWTNRVEKQDVANQSDSHRTTVQALMEDLPKLHQYSIPELASSHSSHKSKDGFLRVLAFVGGNQERCMDLVAKHAQDQDEFPIAILDLDYVRESIGIVMDTVVRNSLQLVSPISS